MALRIVSAYRTVSNEAAMVVAGILPIQLLAMERAQVERAKRSGIAIDAAKDDARRQAMTRWQSEWDTAANGRWTNRLIPNIWRWMERKHRQVNDHITQFLTGHGCFNAYLLRFKRRYDKACIYCQYQEDDIEHTFFWCDRWLSLRRELEVALNVEITPESLMEEMLRIKKFLVLPSKNNILTCHLLWLFKNKYYNYNI